MFSLKTRLAALGLSALSLVAVACADNVDLGQQTNDGDASVPGLVDPTTDGGDADAPEEKVLACIGTECPAPYATCTDRPFPKCGTNLMNDPNNCGECGHSCQGFEDKQMEGRCVNGSCVFSCMFRPSPVYPNPKKEFRDCNKLLDDGCEINVTDDSDNCGSCGHECADGVNCIQGKCGCLNGLTECSLQCVDTRTDDYNCGSCGTLCDAFPADACSPMPTQTIYGCGESACGALKCKSGYADCNKDLKELCNSDGCEANLDTDVENCGSCGVKCGPGQVCRDDGFGPQCQDPCEKAGLATCAQGCADLLSDPYNCGACSNFCPWPGAHQLNSCKKGLCAYECEDGYADCNNDPLDGCEVDLRIHPANCGACGNECRHGEGQPCIAGKCLMVECDGGAETR